MDEQNIKQSRNEEILFDRLEDISIKLKDIQKQRFDQSLMPRDTNEEDRLQKQKKLDELRTERKFYLLLSQNESTKGIAR